MRNLFVALIPYIRRYLPPAIAFSLPFVAGCITAAAEQPSNPNAIHLTWDTLLTFHGPMALMLAWFIRRDEQRRSEDAEHRKEWTSLIRSNTEALTNVAAMLIQTNAGNEKNRLATYKLAEEIKGVCVKVDNICDGLARGTRVMSKEG